MSTMMDLGFNGVYSLVDRLEDDLSRCRSSVRSLCESHAVVVNESTISSILSVEPLLMTSGPFFVPLSPLRRQRASIVSTRQCKSYSLDNFVGRL